MCAAHQIKTEYALSESSQKTGKVASLIIFQGYDFNLIVKLQLKLNRKHDFIFQWRMKLPTWLNHNYLVENRLLLIVYNSWRALSQHANMGVTQGFLKHRRRLGTLAPALMMHCSHSAVLLFFQIFTYVTALKSRP